MGEFDFEGMKKGIFAQLENDKMDGIDVADLEAAMSHPEAKRTVAELMPIEAASVQAGQPAPDFTLPWLPGRADGEGESFTLSEKHGKRPVALIFGSYT
jgi:hypothetical protein